MIGRIIFATALLSGISAARAGEVATTLSGVADQIGDGTRKELVTNLQRSVKLLEQAQRTQSTEVVAAQNKTVIASELAAKQAAIAALTGKLSAATTPPDEARRAADILTQQAQPLSGTTQSIIDGMNPATRERVSQFADNKITELKQQRAAIELARSQAPASEKLDFVSQAQQVQQAITVNQDVKSAVLGRGRTNPHLRQFVEEALQSLLRPLFPICNSVAWSRDDQDFDGWLPQITDVLKKFPLISLSVGELRVRIGENPPLWVGSAFVVNSNTIVTNHHVVTGAIGYSVNGVWSFYDRTSVEFVVGAEYDGCQPVPIKDRIIPVLGIIAGEKVPEKGWDYALLRVDSPDVPPPLPLADDLIHSGTTVAVVGFPGEPKADDIDPSRYTVEEVRKRLFMTPDSNMPASIKRISPGRLGNQDTGGRGMPFNYNTFGGSSGSPVIRLSDGAVVGLHFKGLPALTNGSGYNLAMPAAELAKIVNSHRPSSAK